MILPIYMALACLKSHIYIITHTTIKEVDNNGNLTNRGKQIQRSKGVWLELGLLMGLVRDGLASGLNHSTTSPYNNFHLQTRL